MWLLAKQGCLPKKTSQGLLSTIATIKVTWRKRTPLPWLHGRIDKPGSKTELALGLRNSDSAVFNTYILSYLNVLLLQEF